MSLKRDERLHNLRRLPRWAPPAVGAVVLLAVGWWILPDRGLDLPSVVAESGEFVIDLNETGRLRAEKSVTVSAPPIRINLQIIDLVPEGTVVKKGDLLVQFDTTEIDQRIDDQIAEIDISRANLERTLASMESDIAGLRSAVEDARASYRLAELWLEQYKFEADVKVEEGKLHLLQSKLALERAETQLKAQMQIDSAEVRSLELKIRQEEIDLQKMLHEKERLTITAPAPGLVVYKKTWRGGEMSKIQIGDTPWRGQALIELPDLSVMLVETTVNEVDVSKIGVGLPAEIKLEAYPDPTFHGEVIDVASLARSEEGLTGAKVFDVLVRIKGSNPILKPGMSAKVRIIVDRIPDRVWVPIEALFNRGDRMVVYEKAGSDWREVEVEIGPRNDDFVVIESGIEAGASVALVDPTRTEKVRAVSAVSERPSVPEGSTARAASKPRRSSRRSRR